MKATLTAPLSQLNDASKDEQRHYRPGVISYTSGDGETRFITVKLKTRGNFRRQNCVHPPLRLNFKKNGNEGTPFEGQNKIKLLGPCNDTEESDDYVILENIAYRFWELLSDYHLKTRTMDLAYFDTDAMSARNATAFLIENKEDAAARLNGGVFDKAESKKMNIDDKQAALFELFQFMIGNTDFSYLNSRHDKECCHNSLLLEQPSNEDGLIPIPYDFDSSGFVNAEYAKPDPKLPIRSVRERYFLGFCKDRSIFRDAATKIHKSKTELYEIISVNSLLNDKTKSASKLYLDEFFEIIDSPQRFKSEILDSCVSR